jgi:transposase InsO family protein
MLTWNAHTVPMTMLYIPRVMRVKSEADLLDEALGYIYYYNNLREHSSLNFQTPFSYLKAQLPEVEDWIRYFFSYNPG